MLANEVHFFDALEFLSRRVFIKRDFKTLLFCITRSVASNSKSYVLYGVRERGAFIAKYPRKVMLTKQTVSEQCVEITLRDGDMYFCNFAL